jgi:hypothetical protein
VRLFAVYLITNDVARFDRAVCNKVKRSIHLLFLQSNDIVLSGYYKHGCGDMYYKYGEFIRDSEFINEDKYVSWLNLRGIKVNHFTCRVGLSIVKADNIAGFSTNLVSFQLLVSSFKESRSVHIPSFIRIVKICKSLTSLQLG